MGENGKLFLTWEILSMGEKYKNLLIFIFTFLQKDLIFLKLFLK